MKNCEMCGDEFAPSIIDNYICEACCDVQDQYYAETLLQLQFDFAMSH